MSEAEKDTREWTVEGVLAGSVEDQGLKLDTVLVPKSALTAALEERDEAQAAISAEARRAAARLRQP